MPFRRSLLSIATAATLIACGGPRGTADVVDAATTDTGNDDVTTMLVDVSDPDAATDASISDVTASDASDASTDASASLLTFGVFGDVRPPNFNATADYPTAIVTSVMDGLQGQGAQFAIATGDYMFAYDNSGSAANAQLDLLLQAESHFTGPVFHAMGNHECTTASTSNCPNGDESALVQAFHTRLIPTHPTLYYDWSTPTPLGNAHFIVTAPNAWSTAQAAWLDTALALPDQRYTIVVAHEPPTSNTIPPGTMPIEAALALRTGGITLRLYGHVHFYRHTNTNSVVVGNGGAPLSGTSSGAVYGFTVVRQRADGDIVVTAYEVGTPPMVMESFVLHPDGTPGA